MPSTATRMTISCTHNTHTHTRTHTHAHAHLHALAFKTLLHRNSQLSCFSLTTTQPHRQAVKANSLMNDRRIVRGNTFARKPQPVDTTKPVRHTNKNVPKFQQPELPRVPTPEPVPGRHHMQVQTDNYLEDLRDKIQEHDFGTQTGVCVCVPFFAFLIIIIIIIICQLLSNIFTYQIIGI